MSPSGEIFDVAFALTFTAFVGFKMKCLDISGTNDIYRFYTSQNQKNSTDFRIYICVCVCVCVCVYCSIRYSSP